MAENGTRLAAIRQTRGVVQSHSDKGLCFRLGLAALLCCVVMAGRAGKRGNGEGRAAHGQRGMAAVCRIAAGEGQRNWMNREEGFTHLVAGSGVEA